MDSNSRALPMRVYRDPADWVELNQLDNLGCKVCVKSGWVLDRLLCTESKNRKQVGVPWTGHRCRWFVLKETA